MKGDLNIEVVLVRELCNFKKVFCITSIYLGHGDQIWVKLIGMSYNCQMLYLLIYFCQGTLACTSFINIKHIMRQYVLSISVV